MESKSSHHAIVGADGAARRVEKPAPKLEPLRPEPPFPELTATEMAARRAHPDRLDGPTLTVECTKCRHVRAVQCDYQIPAHEKTQILICTFCGSGVRMTLHKILTIGDRIIVRASNLGVAERRQTRYRVMCEECRTERIVGLDDGTVPPASAGVQRIPYHCEKCWPGSPTDKTQHRILAAVIGAK